MTISVSNLGKRFNREWIFRGLTQDFRSGTAYAITGPNGSGKSTLMQVLWGQVPESEGTIGYKINGTIISADEIFTHVSIATPYMDLIEEFTLVEQVDFHFKFKKPMAGLVASDIIQKMKLEAARDKPIRQFSSGMKQRLKLGLAMFSAGEVLFLDEPTTNLDSQSVAWYNANLIEIIGEKLIFIATNQSSDYPKGTLAIDLTNLKMGKVSASTGYEPE